MSVTNRKKYGTIHTAQLSDKDIMETDEMVIETRNKLRELAIL